MGALAETLTKPAEAMLWYAGMLCEDIPDDKFAVKTIQTLNHPAFIMGHLTVYPEELLNHIGRGDLAIDNADYDKLFGMGVECKNDPSIYPNKTELTARFRDRHNVLIGAIADMTDEQLLAPNPTDFLKESCPTLAAMLLFSLHDHVMMHLGQISAWRRTIGLGSVM
ncbi:MAG: DinB family protein [Phycisphaerales bacterium]|nr:DinB family protein [Phycisphaerales bacterium]